MDDFTGKKPGVVQFVKSNQSRSPDLLTSCLNPLTRGTAKSGALHLTYETGAYT
jgi:hypothetical protein